MLEAGRASRPGAYWFGDAFGHCDIIVTTMLRNLNDCLPGQVNMTDFPALAAHAAKMEALEVFQEIQQVFIAPT